MNFDGLDSQDPEYDSVDDCAEFLIDDDQVTFDHRVLQCLNYRLQRPIRALRTELESWGLTLAARPHKRHFRDLSSNDHDRWYGKGSSRSYGGSGWEQIAGFSGQEG